MDNHDISSGTMTDSQFNFIRTVHRYDPDRLILFQGPERGANGRLQYTGHVDVQAGRISPSSTADFPSPVNATANFPSPVKAPFVSPPPATDNGAPVASNDVITSPSKNKIRNVNLHNQAFHSQKQHFSFDIPVSHRIVHGKYLTELEKDREALHQLRDGTWLQRFAKSANSKLKTYLAVALAAAPALAVTAAGYFIPMVVTAFLHHYGLFGKVGKLENYAKSFPSETYLRERIIETAAENLVWLAYELDDKKVFLSCDKGEY